ncbi:MAG: anti-sigma F factor [Oscillospiraceae bacterium]|nr:anti-sigma F factor [Oscillospiraceae bacterium]
MTVNEFKMTVDSRSVNEGFARTAVAAFAAQLDPTLEEINDIKTAVSEAVTNCIVHGYKNSVGKIFITVRIKSESAVLITIKDRGAGIEDIKKAREPLFTTGGGDRAGLGFSVMESFTDKLTVRSCVGRGTTVTLYKRIYGRAK